MSANVLLVNGKLNPSYLPAGIVPENPVFESVAIVPPGGSVGYLSVENPAGDAFAIQKNLDGSVFMYQTPAGGTANVVLSVDNTGNEIILNGGLIQLGDPTDATPNVEILGSAGTGNVYDSKYNQAIKQDQALTGLGSFTLTSAPASTGTFTPAITGTYIFQTIFSIPNVNKSTVIDNNGLIEWYVFDAGGEIIGGSMTVLGSTMNAPNSVSGVVAPIDWTYTNICYLTAGTEYTYVIGAFAGDPTPDGTWSVFTSVRVIQAC